MEIIIVGWHFADAPNKCRDCDNHADFLVAYKGDWDSFDLCSKCAYETEYVVVEDKIDKIFRDLGM